MQDTVKGKSGAFPLAAASASELGFHAPALDKLRRAIEWPPGWRLVSPGRWAHRVAAALIEAVAKVDFRAFLRSRIIEPLGLGRELFVGMPDAEHGRAVAMYVPEGKQQKALADSNTAP